jgi:hypothetical protein
MTPSREPATRRLRLLDAMDVEKLPSGSDAYGGYVGGQWPTWKALCARFPHARLVSIAVNVQETALILDVESGDADVRDAVAWLRRQNAASGLHHGVYAALDTWAGLLPRLERGGLTRFDFRLWSAHWTGRPHLCDECCLRGFTTTAGATQWRQEGSHGAWDESVATLAFLPEPGLRIPASTSGSALRGL